MEQDVAKHKDAIAGLCRSLGVESLLAFGPGARAPSPAANVGLAFLVQFKPMPSAQYAANYFRLAAELETLLQAPIELAELEAADNPYFEKAVGESRVPVHELSRG